MSEFSDARVLITGAGSGIGAAAAAALAAAGAQQLILVDRDGERLREVAAGLPCRSRLILGDVADEDLWQHADLGRLTHAVLNAGVAAAAPIRSLELAEWRHVMQVNLDGAFLSLKAVLASMDDGAVALTASAAGLKAEPGIAAYAASKAAVIQLARVAAKECAPRIRVNVIAPGGTETRIWSDQPFFTGLVHEHGSQEAAYRSLAAQGTPMGRFAKPEEVAAAILFLLSDKAAFITGACLVMDGGYSL